MSELFLKFLPAKVFNVLLNHQHSIISDLDIFARVGRAAAYDEVAKFNIRNGQLIVQGESSIFKGTLSIDFSKVQMHEYRTGKCNIIIMLFSTLHSVPNCNLVQPNNYYHAS